MNAASAEQAAGSWPEQDILGRKRSLTGGRKTRGTLQSAPETTNTPNLPAFHGVGRAKDEQWSYVESDSR